MTDVVPKTAYKESVEIDNDKMVTTKKWVRGYWRGRGKSKVWIKGHYITVNISMEEYLKRQRKALKRIFG